MSVQCRTLNLTTVHTTTTNSATAATAMHTTITWRRGVVVSVVGLINEVNQLWAQLVLQWVTIF